jgi:hypothetical protein
MQVNELFQDRPTIKPHCPILADLSNDATYGELLFETFGRRVIGVHIGRSGDGATLQRRSAAFAQMPVSQHRRRDRLSGQRGRSCHKGLTAYRYSV